MKKILGTLILATLASTSFAQTAVGEYGLTSTTKYEYNRRANGYRTMQEVRTGLGLETSVGTFDGSIIGSRYRFQGHDDILGFEVGYSNGIKLNAGSLTGRVGYGQRNNVDYVNGGYANNSQYYSLGAEFKAPVTNTISGFIGAEHRNAFNSSVAEGIENRYNAGVELGVTKSLAARVGYQHSVLLGKSYNGVITSVALKF